MEAFLIKRPFPLKISFVFNFPLVCSAVYPSLLIRCEIPSFRHISSAAVLLTLGFNGTEWHDTFGAKRHTHKKKKKKNMKEGKYPSIHFLPLIWVQVTEAEVYPEAPSLSLGSSLHSQPAEQCNLPSVFRFAMGASSQ